MTKRRRGAVQRGDSKLANDHFPMCSPPPGILRDSQSREEKGEGGDRGDLGEKRESQKGERAIKPVITPLSKSGY